MPNTPSLKHGDRVFYDNHDGLGVPSRSGQEGTVTHVFDKYSVNVRWDDGSEDNHWISYIQKAPKKPEAPKGRFYVIAADLKSFETQDEAEAYAKDWLKDNPEIPMAVVKSRARFESVTKIKEVALA